MEPEVTEPAGMSQMRREALEIPAAAARLLAADALPYRQLAERFHAAPPAQWLTVARGSSDHAASHLAFLVMTVLALPVASVPMSVFTLHQARWTLRGAWAVALSQSGRSPDLVETLGALRRAGAWGLALVNDEGSPLAAAADTLLPLHAGPERAVAATKSFVNQLLAGVRLVAALAEDQALDKALVALPAVLEHAQAGDWSAAIPALVDADRLYVIGRGTGLALAHEMALKFKELCGLQAEAHSAAELRHGPMALVKPGYPVIVLAPAGPAQEGLLGLARDLRQRGARVLLAAPRTAAADADADADGGTLQVTEGGHPALHTLTLAQSAYLMIESLARARGLDPDQPRHLSKVTITR
jgi:glutamine---fructose-6-phosphate transaminase (isomerizing)